MVVGSIVHFVAIRSVSRGRVLPGVTMAGMPLSGLDEAALGRRLRALSAKVERVSGRVQVRGRTFDVAGPDFGLALDVNDTAKHALSLGRQGSWFGQVAWYFARPFSDARLLPSVRFDGSKLEARLASLERAALGDAAVEGNVSFTDRIVTTPPRAGLAIIRPGAIELLRRALVERPGEATALPVAENVPKVTRAEVEDAAAAAARLLAPIVLRKSPEDAALTFSTDDLGRALRSRVVDRAPHLEVFLDRDALRPVLARARPALERPARDATFDVKANHEISLVPSALGTRLDDEAVLDTTLGLASAPERTGVLSLVEDVAPALSTEQAEALHVRALVSRYTTPFPCCEARVKNIERMAALVNGSIVRPGEQYSLNLRSGQRSASNGFVAGPTIVEGEMEMTVGGGVSQFATTMFNAAFDGGYEIVQRQPHTYWFPRYPEGYDATLGFPLPDLIFRNDTAAAIFIKTEVGKNFVRVEFYGDNGGRKVERHVSPRFDIVKPDTVLEPNADLPPDETKVLFGGWIGWSLHVSRVITFPDGQKKEERRKVTYSPRARRVETHPCHIPEGAPGYTGEKCPKVESPDGGVR